jgi:hypothetical protein
LCHKCDKNNSFDQWECFWAILALVDTTFLKLCKAAFCLLSLNTYFLNFFSSQIPNLVEPNRGGKPESYSSALTRDMSLKVFFCHQCRKDSTDLGPKLKVKMKLRKNIYSEQQNAGIPDDPVFVRSFSGHFGSGIRMPGSTKFVPFSNGPLA